MAQRLTGVLVAALGSIAIAAPAAVAGVEKSEVIEKRIRSEAPHAKQVKASVVRIHDPLTASGGAHPEACDWISYLRFRNADGPGKARRADAIAVIIPGFLGGAGSFDQLARNTVRRAAKRGRDVEYWSLDRRANCLEDHMGVRAAAKARDATVAYDYYWNGGKVKGRTFDGFVTPEDAGFLREFGLRRTMEDWYTVLRTGIHSRRVRERKVICGGHSLGGPLTASFASWDFDGDPETTKDAGYRQCAALVGLDTSLALGGSGAGLGLGDIVGDVVGGAAPYVNVPPLTPEVIQVPNVFGVGAYFEAQATTLLPELPQTPGIDLSQRILFSKDAVNFATDSPSIRDFNLTNEAALAGVFDDNSAPIFFLRSSVGQVVGGPLADKNFPLPSDGTIVLPEDPATPLYSWERYREVGRQGGEVSLNGSGEPYTTRESEVSDLRQLARTMFEPPLDFTEQYFPIRILTDVVAAAVGDRSGDLAALQHDGVAKKPGLLIQAGDSGDNLAPDQGPPFAGESPPNDLPGSAEVIIPGYNHLDVGTAAWRQNDGRREPTSANLARFMRKAVSGKPGR